MYNEIKAKNKTRDHFRIQKEKELSMFFQQYHVTSGGTGSQDSKRK